MRLLLDEMYSPALAKALREVGIDAVTVMDPRLVGAPDAQVFASATTDRRAVLTENVADFARLAAEKLTSGGHHAGLIVALSPRFSRRPAGRKHLVAAISAIADQQPDDRLIYLQRADRRS